MHRLDNLIITIPEVVHWRILYCFSVVTLQVSKMLPEEDGSSHTPISTLVGNDQRKPTIATVVQNAAAPLRPQTAKRNSESSAAPIRSNPWEDEKRASIMEGRSKSGRASVQGGRTLPGHLKQLGRGLNCRFLIMFNLYIAIYSAS